MGEDWSSGPVAVLRNLQLLNAHARTTSSRPVGRSRPSLELAPERPGRREGVPDRAGSTTCCSPASPARSACSADVTLDQADRTHRPDLPPRRQARAGRGAGARCRQRVVDRADGRRSTKLFAEDRVCILKMNPVNEHLGPHIAEAFQALVRAGFLRIVYGGGEVGALPDATTTTSTRSTSPARTRPTTRSCSAPARRAPAARPRTTRSITKPITSELGNVTPVIVVPGPWSRRGHRLPRRQHRVDAGQERRVQLHRRPRDHHPPAVGAAPRPRQRDPRLAAPRRAARALLPGRGRPVARVHRRPPAGRVVRRRHGRGPGAVHAHPRPRPATTATTSPSRPRRSAASSARSALDAPRVGRSTTSTQAVEFCNEHPVGHAVGVDHRPPEVAQGPRDRRGGRAGHRRPALRLGRGQPLVGRALRHGVDHVGRLPRATRRTDIQSGTGVVHNTYLLEDVEKSVVPRAVPRCRPSRRGSTPTPQLHRARAGARPSSPRRGTRRSCRACCGRRCAADVGATARRAPSDPGRSGRRCRTRAPA